MRWTVLMIVVLASAFTGRVAVAAAALDAFAGQKGELDIAGGTAHIPVMKCAARAIMEANPEIRITIAGGGTGMGIVTAGQGLAHIGNIGRQLKPEEAAAYGLKSFPFAIDGVAAVVHPANTVSGLTKSQLAGIFSGNIRNWKEVGGADAPVTLYNREDGSGTREVFVENALGGADISPKASIVNANGAMKTVVMQDENAIGYVGIGHLDATVKGIVLDGMTPSQDNAADGTYGVTRRLFMVTRGEPEGLAKTFIEYIYSDAGAACIRAAGYIPVARP